MRMQDHARAVRWRDVAAAAEAGVDCSWRCRVPQQHEGDQSGEEQPTSLCVRAGEAVRRCAGKRLPVSAGREIASIVTLGHTGCIDESIDPVREVEVMARGTSKVVVKKAAVKKAIARSTKASAKLEGRVVPPGHRRSAAVSRYIAKQLPPKR